MLCFADSEPDGDVDIDGDEDLMELPLPLPGDSPPFSFLRAGGLVPHAHHPLPLQHAALQQLAALKHAQHKHAMQVSGTVGLERYNAYRRTLRTNLGSGRVKKVQWVKKSTPIS